MKIYRSIYDFTPSAKTVVTLGTFDGVHIGHRKIIEKLLQSAADTQSQSVILTFFPHPRMVLQDRSEIQLLNTLEEKIGLLEHTGLDHLIIHRFDEAFSRLTAEEFVSKILVGQFNIEKIIIGHDHRFGRNRTANIDDLIGFGNEFGFAVEQISAQEIDAVSVSSTKIRNALHDGNIGRANEYLGYPYMLSGIVVKGRQIGRTIGYPTANIHIAEDYKLIPKIGVYVVCSTIEGRLVNGMMSIGTNPTVGGTQLSVEVHFFDFDADLYGKRIVISLLGYLREEKKFESVDALQQAIAADQAAALKFLSEM